MDTEYYVVVVQDIGERLEYEYTDYDKAVHLMETEALAGSIPVQRLDAICPSSTKEEDGGFIHETVPIIV